MINLDQYHSEGFQVLRNQIPVSEIRSMRTFLESELNALLSEIRSVVEFEDVGELVQKVNAYEGVDLPSEWSRETQNVLTGQFSLKTRLSEYSRFSVNQKSVRETVAEILEPDSLRLHMPPMMRYVLPEAKLSGVPAHQDIIYNSHMKEFVTVWIPFNDTDSQCGGVAVYRNSNVKKNLLNAERNHFWFPKLDTEGYQREELYLNAGDFLLLSPWVIHESMSNYSAQIRMSMDSRFFDARSNSDKHYLDLNTMEVVEPKAPVV